MFKISYTKTIYVLMVIFLWSAVCRIGPAANFAQAQSLDSTTSDDSASESTEGVGPFRTTEDFLRDLQQRERELVKQEHELRRLQKELNRSALDLEEQIIELKNAEDSLSETMAIADQIFEEDLQNLTRVYENMKPKNAANLFEEMAPEFAAGFLSKLSNEKAADILTFMDPKVAYSISVIIAGRNSEIVNR